MAHIGPGSGWSAIGSLFAFIAAIRVAIVGFMWYPLKHMLRSRQVVEQADASPEADVPAGMKNPGAVPRFIFRKVPTADSRLGG